MERFYFFKDLWQFLKQNKKWWIIPLVAFLILLGILIYLIVHASVTAMPIFIYPLV